MSKIIECVPNFSEGRDKNKIDTIVSCMTAINGVTLLDKESDADHNRSVITIVVFEIGIKGTTSVAPILGCSPLWFRKSISSVAFLIPSKTASKTWSGSPTMVITERL